ncbi:MAG: sigma factor-like helix-turn-helix DNA-binding protein [Candidatus Peregrinibacteria bacterium]
MDNSSIAPLTQTVSDISSLVDNLLLLLSDKEKLVVTKRFSISGMKKHTLDEIGKELSVTRERVRQIEKNALYKMRRNVFNTSLKHLHDFSLGILRNHGGLISETSLFDELKKIMPPNLDLDNGGIHLSLVLNDQVKCVGNTVNFCPYIRESGISDFSLKYASNHLVNQLNKYGDAKKLDKLHRDLKGLMDEVNFDVEGMKSLISIDKRVALLEDDLVGLVEWRHLYPRTLRDKILYILRQEKTSMHFVDISERITNANFDNRQVNLQAVHNELIRHDQFVLIGRGIYALSEWGYEKGTVENVIGKILKQKKELSQDEIVDAVLKQRQVKKITVVLVLKNSGLFERVGRKMYRLKKTKSL